MQVRWLCMDNALEMHLLMMKTLQFAKMVFLEEVTVSWEDEFHKFTKDGVRQIALRISFILGLASGAFPLLKKDYRALVLVVNKEAELNG